MKWFSKRYLIIFKILIIALGLFSSISFYTNAEESKPTHTDFSTSTVEENSVDDAVSADVLAKYPAVKAFNDGIDTISGDSNITTEAKNKANAEIDKVVSADNLAKYKAEDQSKIEAIAVEYKAKIDVASSADIVNELLAEFNERVAIIKTAAQIDQNNATNNGENQSDKEAANSVVSLINKINTNDKASIEAARKAYNSLTTAQKSYISAATLKKLTDAEYIVKQKTNVSTDEKTSAKKNTNNTWDKKGKLVKAKSPDKGTIYVKWKKVKGASGYYFMISRKKSFPYPSPNNTFKQKIDVKKLKGKYYYRWIHCGSKKTYYIRMCPYKKIGNKKYIYGKWSNVKKVKTK